MPNVNSMEDTQKGRPLPAGMTCQAASIGAPTLVMAGGASPDWLRSAAQAAAQAIHAAQFRILPGQNHGVEARAFAPILIEFFQAK
jgi:pimeloyl-ACP methyl ester carboxylesterase